MSLSVKHFIELDNASVSETFDGVAGKYLRRRAHWHLFIQKETETTVRDDRQAREARRTGCI